MAEIYLARQKTELGATRRCVVKQILPEFASDPRFSDMLVHEAKLAARLSHANVVHVLDLGREDGRLFIAMEYVEGFDLNDLLRRCSAAQVPLPSVDLAVCPRAPRGVEGARLRPPEDRRRGRASWPRTPRRVALESARVVRRRGQGVRLRNRARQRRDRRRRVRGHRRSDQRESQLHEPRTRAGNADRRARRRLRGRDRSLGTRRGPAPLPRHGGGGQLARSGATRRNPRSSGVRTPPRTITCAASSRRPSPPIATPAIRRRRQCIGTSTTTPCVRS